MKSLLLFSLFLLFFFSAKAQNEVADAITLHGKLIKKEWSKSPESDCAQGTEYYILEVNNTKRTVILQFDASISKTKQFENENVIVVGQHIEKTISRNQINDEVKQKAIQQMELSSEEEKAFTCHVFEVKIITLE